MRLSYFGNSELRQPLISTREGATYGEVGESKKVSDAIGRMGSIFVQVATAQECPTSPLAINSHEVLGANAKPLKERTISNAPESERGPATPQAGLQAASQAADSMPPVVKFTIELKYRSFAAFAKEPYKNSQEYRMTKNFILHPLEAYDQMSNGDVQGYLIKELNAKCPGLELKSSATIKQIFDELHAYHHAKHGIIPDHLQDKVFIPHPFLRF